ncbi:MAG TPA: altronate dehydratase family protein [Candidatus Acidoferrales bacterium]|nr:altronate dehydratase family protein [Candidatus Acidoferrales bacterium]
MLLDIEKLPTAENSAIHLHPTDNVAVARVSIPAGTTLRIDGLPVTTLDAIPAGHKVALWDIQPGEVVERYGQVIGRAKQPIDAGRHIHTHNLAFEELQLEYEFPVGDTPMPTARLDAPTFLGYQREDGRVGTRNYIAVVAASNCAAHTAEQIARSYEGETMPPNVDGVMAFPHGEGCAHAAEGPDIDQLRRTLSGVLIHPNVSAAVILGLGCEVNQIDHYLGAGGPRSTRLAGLTLQSSGGTRGAIEASRRQISRFLEQASAEQRTPAPASKIVLGLNCGGSDSFSGITANPALGFCSDLLAELGGTPVLAETTEIFGAEHLLVKRARNREVAEKLLDCIRKYKVYLNRFAGSFDDNPSPGNKEGGLTNILEKSLGAVAKGGTSPLIDVYDYAERVTAPGFTFMNTPGYDPVSLTGLAAGGCNLIAFTTGRGSAIGFPTIPVIKVATNSNTYRRMTDNMDVNAGAIADGEATVQQIGRAIFDLMLEVASGRHTCAERLGHKEFVPWRIGPVM